jgi:hypothetical protein
MEKASTPQATLPVAIDSRSVMYPSIAKDSDSIINLISNPNQFAYG